jgi:hypothetical protein
MLRLIHTSSSTCGSMISQKIKYTISENEYEIAVTRVHSQFFCLGYSILMLEVRLDLFQHLGCFSCAIATIHQACLSSAFLVRLR